MARSLTFKVGILTFNQVTVQVASTLIGIVVARMLTRDELGTFRQLTLLSGLITPLFIAGLPASILFFMPRLTDVESRQSFVAQTVLILGFSGLALAALMNAFSDPIATYFNNPELQDLLPQYSLNVFMTVTASYFYLLMVAIDRLKFATLHTVGFGLLNLFGQLAGIFVSTDAYGLVLGSNVARAIQLALTLLLTIRVVGLKGPGSGTVDVSDQFRYAVPLALSSMVGVIGYQIDQLVVGRFLDPAMFAVYVIGAIEIPVIQQLAGSANSVLVPAMAECHSRGDTRGILDLWGSATRKLGLIVFPTFWFFMVFAGDFIQLLYSQKYAGSVDFFRIYLLLTPLRVTTFSLVATATGRTGQIFSGAVLFTVSNIGLSIALVVPMGAYGPAIATVICSAGLAGYYLIRIKPVLNVTVREILPWRMMGRQFTAAGFVGLIAALTLLFDLGHFYSLIVGGCSFIIAYFFIFRSVGLLTKDDVGSMWSVIVRHMGSR